MYEALFVIAVLILNLAVFVTIYATTTPPLIFGLLLSMGVLFFITHGYYAIRKDLVRDRPDPFYGKTDRFFVSLGVGVVFECAVFVYAILTVIVIVGCWARLFSMWTM